jgi:hypothetical protein
MILAFPSRREIETSVFDSVVALGNGVTVARRILTSYAAGKKMPVFIGSNALLRFSEIALNSPEKRHADILSGVVYTRLTQQVVGGLFPQNSAAHNRPHRVPTGPVDV